MFNRRRFFLITTVVLCLFGLGVAQSAMANAIYWENVDTGQTVTQLSLLKGQDPADTATIRLSFMSTSVILAWHRISTRLARRASFTMGSIFATL